MDQLEQGMTGLTELIDRYAKEIQAVLEEDLVGAQKPSWDDLRRKITEVQDRICRGALEMYGHLERELDVKLNPIQRDEGARTIAQGVRQLDGWSRKDHGPGRCHRGAAQRAIEAGEVKRRWW